MIISPEDRESFTKWLEFQPGTEHLIDTAKSTDKISTNIKYGSSNIERDIEMPQLAKLWSFQNGKLDPDEMMKPGQDLWSLDKFDKYHDQLRLPKDVALKQISRDISKNYRIDNFPAYRARWGDDIFKDVKPAFSDESYKKLLSRKPSPYDKVMVDATLKARRGVSPEEIDKYIRTGDPGKKQSQVVMAASELSHLSKYKRLPDTSELKGKYIIENIAKHKNLGDTSKTYYNQELDSAARSWLGTSSNVSRPTAGYQLEKTAALFPPKGKDRAASFEFEMEGGSGVKTLNFLRNLKGKKRDLFNKYFELDTDGTLAGGGLELKPSMVPKKDMKASIGLAQELMRKGGWTTGKNTSTHLHVDARDLVDKSNPNLGPKPNQMLSFLRRNDHLLETVVNPSRVGNKYAQRVGRLPHAGMTGHNLNIVSESLTKYGTYENRMLEGTSDPSKVKNWYDFNQALVGKNASSDLSKQPYHEKFSDMTKAVGAPKSTVDYYKDLERKMDPMSRNIIPVHPRSLLEGEKLYDAQGKLKPIEQFQVGDEILSYDVENHKLVTSYVVDKFDHLADNVCTATLQTSRRSEQAKLTSDHPTLTTGNTYTPINEDKEWVWLPGQTLTAWRINHNPILKAKQISNRSKGEAHSKATSKGMTAEVINNGVRTKLDPIPGTQRVWDLQCEPYKNFIHESGLVLHNCRCYWEKVRVMLAKILPEFRSEPHLTESGLNIIRGMSEHFIFAVDHTYNTLRWYKKDEYSSRNKIFKELIDVDPSIVPDKLLIQPDHDIGIKIPEKRAMTLIAQSMKDSDHAPSVPLQGEFRIKLDDDMRRYQIKAAKRIQSSLSLLKNGKIDRIEARRQFDSARLSMKHMGVQAIKTRTQQLTQSSVVESAMKEGVEELIFRTKAYKACRVCKALNGKHFRTEDVNPLKPNVQNALGVPDKDLFKPKPARMSTRKSRRRVILMRDGSKLIRH